MDNDVIKVNEFIAYMHYVFLKSQEWFEACNRVQLLALKIILYKPFMIDW